MLKASIKKIGAFLLRNAAKSNILIFDHHAY